MTFTKEQLTRIIESADEVITALAGTNEDCHRESDGMIRLWDYLNDVAAPPAIVKKLAEMALAGMEAEPVAHLYSASFERGHVEGELTDAPGCDMPVYSAPQPLTTSERAELENYRNAPTALSIDAFLKFVNEKASETKSSKSFRCWAEGVNNVAEAFKVARSGK